MNAGSKNIGAGTRSYRSWPSEEIRQYSHWLNTAIETEIEVANFPPAVKELQLLVESNPRYRALAYGMYDELSTHNAPDADASHCDGHQSFHHLLTTLSRLLRVPPQWSTQAHLMGVICCPIYVRLFEPMHTTCGFAFFQDPQVNLIIKKILDAWGDFLRSPASRTCLIEAPDGWFSPEAYAYLTDAANLNDDDELRTFEQIYVCEPSRPYHGFQSWDDFFTRQFRDGIRPIAGIDDPNIVIHACESVPWAVTRDIKYRDSFWAKGNRCSLQDMLAHDELSESFVGGTLYRAWLSALSYHRWHAPVSGRIVKVAKVQGQYFSEPLDGGFGIEHRGFSGEESVKGPAAYTAATATRAIIYIDADSTDIGLVAVVLVGMSEISSCEVVVSQGQRVLKGDEMGMFHFGGSMYCMLFRKEVDLVGVPGWSGANCIMPVRGQLACVRKRSASDRQIAVES